MTRYVTIGLAASLTGYSKDAIRTKIRGGVWPERQVWLKAPDNRLLIDMEGYERWVESGSTKALGNSPVVSCGYWLCGAM